MEITVDFREMNMKGQLLAARPDVELMVGDRVVAVDPTGGRCDATVLEVGEQVLLDVEYETYKTA